MAYHENGLMCNLERCQLQSVCLSNQGDFSRGRGGGNIAHAANTHSAHVRVPRI